MKEAYEIVKADELRAGNVIKERARDWLMTVAIINSEERCVKVNYGPPFGFKTQVFRQLPPEQNPDMLERALELLFDMLYDGTSRRIQMESCISQATEQAIRELESEAGR